MTVLKFARIAGVAAVALSAGACAQKVATVSQQRGIAHTAADRECMARAMYFESHRTGDDGMLAVGTVVVNRLASGKYGSSVCDVVGQKRQFAPGVMTRTMEGAAAETARRNADAVLSGKRHAGVRTAMHFHTAGLRFPYPNMHYVLVAGGNAFYEKHDGPDARADNARSRALALAYARVNPAGPAKDIMVASATAPAAAIVTRAAAPAQAAKPAAGTTQVAAVQPAPAVSAPQPVVAQVKVQRPAARPAPQALAYAGREERDDVFARSVSVRRAAMPASARVASREEERPAPERKRTIQPEKAAPALASVTPAPQPAPAAPVEADPAPNRAVAAAFAAFE